ncbi:MAG: KTSC domain-containing protein [Cetobacterium sp.]
MLRIPVSSSNIHSVGYNPDNKILEIQFHSGGIYQYINVPQKTHTNLISASSIGSFFHQYVKNIYSFNKIA